MAKRLITTNLFKKQYMRSLEGKYKLLWIYIHLDCDHAGIWDVDLEAASLYCGFKYKDEEKLATEIFAGRIIRVRDGEKWFSPTYIEAQYKGELNESDRPQESAINILRKHKLWNEEEKTHIRPLQGSMAIVKVKTKVKVKVKPTKLILLDTWNTIKFKQAWADWLKYKLEEHNFKYKSSISQQAGITRLEKLSNKDVNVAMAILTRSMGNTWSGMFVLPEDELQNVPQDKGGKDRAKSKL